MYRVLLTCFIVFSCLCAQAQQNLYIYNGISPLFGWPVLECGNRVYFLTAREDSLRNGLAVRSYYFSSVHKKTQTLDKSILISSDTSFNVYEEIQPHSISYSLDRDNKAFNFFIVTDVDSSGWQLSPNSFYPKRIAFLKLDTMLNTIIPQKPIWFRNRSSRYDLFGVGFSQYRPRNQTLLSYTVRDSNIAASFMGSFAAKFLIVDDTGKILTDEFLGWEPTGTGSQFASHGLLTDINRNYNGHYTVMAMFEDSICAVPGPFKLFRLDSNLHLRDTFDYPFAQYYGISPTGRKVHTFGEVVEHHFFLPTGSLIRSALGKFSYDTSSAVYMYYGLGKGGLETGYRPSQVYFPPTSEYNDFEHSSSSAIIGASYNPYDNKIYGFTSTKSSGYFASNPYCLNGEQNLGQLAVTDTNLQEKWVKYIRPRHGYCIRSSSVAVPDGRDGILITGWETNIDDPNDQSRWYPFIYHIDSSTSLGMANPKSPILITDQFSLYPNPATNHITIENVLGTRYTYAIINGVGQIMASGKGEGITTAIDMQALPAGIYLIRCITADNRGFSLKFQKS